jgi:glutamate-1-semialdehyde 2,1-aminomutase
MNKNEKYFKRAKEVIPGGVNSPVRAFGAVHLTPLFIKYGKGSRIFDMEDRSYIDYVCSWGPLILGHAPEEVLQVLNETAKKGTSFGAPTELEIQLAEKIVEMIPSIDSVRLVNSGTEATMSAVRLARAWTGKNKIIKFEGCYHGHADFFLIKAGSGALTMGIPGSPGVADRIVEDTLIAQYNDIDSVKRLFSKHKHDIAAVIVEPVAGNMGVVLPEDHFLPGLRELCSQFQTLLVFDEVITGFRVHPGGAQALCHVIPDITTLGKIIGGGLPVGAYGGRKEIMQKIAPAGPVYQAGTLSGNPLTVSCGLKTLEIISTKNFYENLNEKANYFFNNIKDIIQKYDFPLSANHVNSMGSLFFKKGGVNNYQDVVQSDTDMYARYFKKMLEKGIYLAPSQFEASFISAAHSKEDLDYTLKSIENTLLEMFK